MGTESLATLNSDFWPMVNAIADSLAALVVTIAAVIAVRHLREASRMRRLEAIQGLLNAIDDRDVREARRRVLSGELPPVSTLFETIEEVRDEETGFTYTRFRVRPQHQEIYEQMRRVWVSFEKIAILEKRGHLSLDDVRDSISSIGQCWMTLRPYIKAVRLRGHDDTAKGFQELAERFIRDSKARKQLGIESGRLPERPQPA